MIAKSRALFLMIEFVITILIINVIIYLTKNNGLKIRRLWANMQAYLMGFKIKYIGEPDKEAKLLLINHQGLVDIIALEGVYPANLCWITKKELENIPLFGHIVRAPKMISIDRKDKRSVIKMLRLSKERIAQGRVIAMFPEGTRAATTELLEFQAGGKILAEKLNIKVQPVIIVNSKYILDSQKMTAHSGDLSIIYLDSIDPKDDKDWYVNMQKNMQKRLNDELANYTSNR